MIDGTVTVAFLNPGTWHNCFANSMLDLVFYDGAHNCRLLRHRHWRMGKETGAGNIHAARNRCAQVFLDDTEAEWLLFIDSDMGFAPDMVDRLVDSADPVERPIMGGLAFAMKSDGAAPLYARRYRTTPTLYTLAETDEDTGFVAMIDYPRDQVVSVAATGAACILLHRNALEKVRAEYGDCWFDHIPKPKGWGSFGEDLSLSLRLAACGIPIHVDTSVKTTHDKGGVYFDEETFDLQQSMLALAEC